MTSSPFSPTILISDGTSNFSAASTSAAAALSGDSKVSGPVAPGAEAGATAAAVVALGALVCAAADASTTAPNRTLTTRSGLANFEFDECGLMFILQDVWLIGVVRRHHGRRRESRLRDRHRSSTSRGWKTTSHSTRCSRW